MSYLPTCCEACRRLALVPVTDSSRGEFVCPACEGIARVIPGGSYTADDLATFDHLRDLLLELKLPAFEAERLALELQRASARGGELAALGQTFEASQPLIRVWRAVQSAGIGAPRAVLMLATILTGLASVRRHSGILVATPGPRTGAGGAGKG